MALNTFRSTLLSPESEIGLSHPTNTLSSSGIGVGAPKAESFHVGLFLTR